MSDNLTFNKIAGAVLATGLAIVGLKQIAGGVFAPEHVEKPGYAVEVKEEAGGGGAAAETPPDWGTVLPKADVAAGEAVFAKCASCHNADPSDANGTGPGLWGVLGRQPAHNPGFAYSDGLKKFAATQPIWDYEHVYEFVKAPQKYIPGTKMTFVGLKKQEDRINLIAFLHSRGSNLPIPAPNPAAAPAAAAGAPTTTEAAPPTPGAPGQGPGAAQVEPADKSASTPAQSH